ncbi:MAG: trehalose-phosphatase [Alphaproteobacteria bacterium]|nr:trehalose-phosphatase [Alphaproteobacteria bacterium]
MAPPALGPDVALFLDFDGTLTPLQDDPDAVFLPDGMDRVILELAEQLKGALAVLSGRDLTDLSRRVPEGLWRFGNHGLRSAEPGEAPDEKIAEAPAGLVSAIRQSVSAHEGVRLEIKGPVLAIHYRAAPDKGDELKAELTEVLLGFDDYSLQSGKMVLEAKPKGANKGICLERAMSLKDFEGRVPVMIGDDRTDEDAFAMAGKLGGWSVKVGEGQTCADYRLSGHHDVIAYLKRELG